MMRRTQRHFQQNWTLWFFTAACVLLINSSLSALPASSISGTVSDPQHRIVQNAQVHISRRVDGFEANTVTDGEGTFAFAGLDNGEYRVTVDAAGFKTITRDVIVGSSQNANIQLQFTEIASQAESVTVTADVGDSGVYSPDPATRVLIRQETLDANPGRPGMPISIPGMPVESSRRSTLFRVWRAITANRSASSSKSAAIYFQTTCQQTRTATATPTRTS